MPWCSKLYVYVNSSHNKECFGLNFGFNDRGLSLTGDSRIHVTAIQNPRKQQSYIQFMCAIQFLDPLVCFMQLWGNIRE